MSVRILLIQNGARHHARARAALAGLTPPTGPAAVACASDWDQAWPRIADGDADLVVLDFALPGSRGLDVLAALADAPHPPVIMLGPPEGDLDTAVESLRAGAHDYVPAGAADWDAQLRLAIERTVAGAGRDRECARARAQLAARTAALETRLADQAALLEAQAAELARLHLKTHETGRLKADIVANVSHELRTPLSAVVGFAELLDALLPATGVDEARDSLRKLRHQAARLTAAVESIVAFDRLRNGNHAPVIARFSLAELRAELHAEALVLSAGKRLAFTWKGPGEPCRVESDRELVRAIAWHLLSNAIKFTPAGVVEVELARGRRGGIVVRVSDTGIGLPPEARALVFEDFRQLDGSSTRRYCGLGLGLGFVKRCTALLGGTLGVSGRPGGGSIFTVRLPGPAGRGSRPLGAHETG
jgi:signal transduction histidine kinase